MKKAKELAIAEDEDSHNELLKTIRIPKKLHNLTNCLPKSNYEPMKSSTNIFREDRSVDKLPCDSFERHSSSPIT
jgi:hypothetical protein